MRSDTGTIAFANICPSGLVIPGPPEGDYILNSRETIEKLNAAHKVYGPALFLKPDDQGRLMTVRYIERTDRCEEDQVFRVENLAGY